MSRTDYVWTVTIKDGKSYDVLSKESVFEDFIHEMYAEGHNSFAMYKTRSGGMVAINVSEVTSIEWF